VACLVATDPGQGIWVMTANGEGMQALNVESIGALLSAADDGPPDNPGVPWARCPRFVALVCAELAVHRPSQNPASGEPNGEDRHHGEALTRLFRACP
jgi:hypothetical protein